MVFPPTLDLIQGSPRTRSRDEGPDGSIPSPLEGEGWGGGSPGDMQTENLPEAAQSDRRRRTNHQRRGPFSTP